MKIGIFTIASKNYIAYARALMASVAEIHPEYKRYLCLADEANGYINPQVENFEIVQADSLGIDTFQDMTIRYDIMEFNTAVKPFMIDWLFANTDLDAVIYLDPDIQVFSKFDILESKLRNGASVVLTPHITQPVEDEYNPNDYHMLQAGVFNLGFIALNRCQEAIDFIRWWGRRLKTQCASDISKNLFTDQKWCDLAPCFLDHLEILKNPGYNVAYWNLVQRKVTSDGNGNWWVNGNPLVFFHFSGVNADKKNLVSKHQNRFSWSDIVSFQSLFEKYLNALVSFGWEDSKQWPYAYALADGSLKIAPALRQLFREKHPQSFDFGSQKVSDYLIQMCNSPAQDVEQTSGPIITDLMLFIYRQRPDLQKVFNLGSVPGRSGFVHWFEVSAAREYGLPPEVTKQSLISGITSSKTLRERIAGLAAFCLGSAHPVAQQASMYLPPSMRKACKSIWLRLASRIYRHL